MRNVRNLALASGAVIALAFGGIALAQETKQPETTAKPEQGQKHEHRGQHGGMHGHSGEKHEHGERC